MGVDIQCCGRLCVSEETSYRRHIRAVGNQKTGIAMSERMHIQFLR